MLLLDGAPLVGSPAAMLAAAARHPALTTATTAFLATPPRPPPQPPPGPLVYVLQGEVAFEPARCASRAAILASGDATTCVIAAVATDAGVSMAHVDGASAPAVATALWSGHEGCEEGSVFLVGGFDDGTPHAAGPSVAAAVLASLAGLEGVQLTLRLAVLASAAAAAGGRGRSGALVPVATSLALTVGTPHPHAAAWEDRGPCIPTRVARLWEALPKDGGGGGGDTNGDASPPPPSDRGLTRVYDGRGVFTVAPLTGACGPPASPQCPPAPAPPASPPSGGWPSRRAALAWLAAQPDAALLAAASTSPAVEPPRFLADLRAALVLLLAGARGGSEWVWRGGWVKAA